jgi:hypothetical protein
MVMNSLIRSLGICLIGIAVAITAVGCADFTLTAPLCGPGSADNSPVERFPMSASGCYESPSMKIHLGNSIIRPLSSEKRDYFWIASHGDTMVLAASGREEPISYGGMCKDPNDPSGRSFLGTGFGTSAGWWSLTYMTFSANWDRIFFAGALIDLGKLKESGIHYTLFPSAKFRTKTQESTSSLSQQLDSSMGITLIDNRNISTAELIERLGIEPTTVFATIKRVPDELCRNAKMKFYKHQGSDLRNAWQPAATVF